MAGEHSYKTFSVDKDFTDADQNTDATLAGYQWDVSASRVITFSFIDSAADLSYALSFGAKFSSEFSAVQQAGAQRALDMFASVIDVTFDEQGDGAGENNADGTLRFMNVSGIGSAFAYSPFSAESGGDMAFQEGVYASPTMGSYAYAGGILHELGHAMGLKHGHETIGSGAIEADKDSVEYSVMTYHSYAGQPDSLPFLTNAAGHMPQTLMMFDIAALQRMYGANFSEQSGKSVYSFSSKTGEMSINGVGQGTPDSNVILRTVWDGGGVDTYNLSNYKTDLRIDLTPGGYSDFDVGGSNQRAILNAGWKDNATWGGSEYLVGARGHLFNALQYEGNTASLIENATGGSGDDDIIGNAAKNLLKGGAGRDFLQGGAANDKLFGGSGSDFLDGGADNDKLIGGGGDDRLRGGAGNDKLKGGGGADVFVFDMSEASGNDKIIGFRNGSDSIEMNGASFGDLDISQAGKNTLVAWDSGEITLKGMNASLIGAEDFDFI